MVVPELLFHNNNYETLTFQTMSQIILSRFQPASWRQLEHFGKIAITGKCRIKNKYQKLYGTAAASRLLLHNAQTRIGTVDLSTSQLQHHPIHDGEQVSTVHTQTALISCMSLINNTYITRTLLLTV